MTFDERLTWLLIGMVIGGILGYFAHALRDIRSTVHHLDDLSHPQDSQSHRDEEGWMKKLTFSDWLLLVVVIVVGYAAIQSQATSNQLKEKAKTDKIQICEGGAENRQVLRALTEAVYDLATGAAKRDPKDPPLTEKERQSYNAYVDRANQFRADMYYQIVPSPGCAPYVDDDKVKPPSDPFPTIPPPVD